MGPKPSAMRAWRKPTALPPCVCSRTGWQAIAEVPGFERLRDAGREVKRHTIENLDYYLNQFAGNVERNGGKMHWAFTAADVCRIVVDIVQQSAAREVVKAKSMVGEEVELNHALEAAGIRAIETDLGEFIIQLAGERPAHIVAPAIHKTREDVSDLFVEHINAERTVVPEEPPPSPAGRCAKCFRKPAWE